MLIQVGSEKKTRLRGGSRFSPNLRSTDRALLPGRAIIHLGVKFGLRNAAQGFSKGGRKFDLRKVNRGDSGGGNGLAEGAHLFRNSGYPICYSTTVGGGSFLPASYGHP